MVKPRVNDYVTYVHPVKKSRRTGQVVHADGDKVVVMEKRWVIGKKKPVTELMPMAATDVEVVLGKEGA